MRLFIQVLLFILPWCIRRRILNMMGHQIAPTAHIGISILLCHRLVMRENSIIGHLTFVKGIDRLELDKNSKIGALNFITGYSVALKSFFKNIDNRNCELIIGESSSITSRHFFDVNGGIYIGKFTQIAGIRSTFLTHSIDVYKNIQTVAPIRIGNYCFCGSNIVVLKGITIKDYTVIGAGSIVSRPIEYGSAVVAGNPAVIKKELIVDDVKYFNRTHAKVE